MTAPSLTFTWDGESMIPLSPRLADKHYVVGQQYRLVEQEERSRPSHNHLFVQVEEIWKNLPDALAVQFPTADILRKHALIMTGWFHERRFAASSQEEARKIAAFLMQRYEDYALISVAGNVVIERIARSQSTRANGMRKAEFQRSKNDVLDWITGLIGVDRQTLAAEAGKAA